MCFKLHTPCKFWFENLFLYSFICKHYRYHIDLCAWYRNLRGSLITCNCSQTLRHCIVSTRCLAAKLDLLVQQEQCEMRHVFHYIPAYQTQPDTKLYDIVTAIWLYCDCLCNKPTCAHLSTCTRRVHVAHLLHMMSQLATLQHVITSPHQTTLSKSHYIR